MARWSLDSTVFATATVPRPGTRAVLRISGPRAKRTVEELFRPDELGGLDHSGRGASPGALHLGNTGLTVRAWIWVFDAPTSYTGQDLVEIHIPSSGPLIRLIEQELMRLGLESAQPGEFTARAFLLGKLELTQAEAINALVRSENDAQLNAALNLLQGRLHHWLIDIHERLVELVSLVEANIDFSEEDIELISTDDLEERIRQLGVQLEAILEQAVDADTLETLPRVFLVGPANAGKSSLLNRLSGLDRAICSQVPGTTRDMLSAVWADGHREVMLVDTAGMYSGEIDQLTAQAVEHTKTYLASGDLYLLVFDLAVDPQVQIELVDSWPLPRAGTLAVLNKADLVGGDRKKEFVGKVSQLFDNAVFTSALTGEGLDELTGRVFDRLDEKCLTFAREQLALNRRQRHALVQSLESLRRVRNDLIKLATGTGEFGFEITAAELQRALGALAELLGKDASENVLDNIFAQFCIGK